MKLINTILYILFISISFAGCSSSDAEGENGSNDNEAKPTLVFPLENSECFEGTIISDTRSEVTFEWNGTAAAKSYILTLKNLDTDKEVAFNATTTSKGITIERGVPYSWYVIAIGERFSDQTRSTVWKFYNAGSGVQNYAPFPADPIYPTMGSKTPRSFLLTWDATDIDNDIVEYDVYLATSNPPTSKVTTTEATEFATGTLDEDTVYYWKVVTKDSHGNQSVSPVFDFKTE